MHGATMKISYRIILFRLVMCSSSSDVSAYILVVVSSVHGSEGGCDQIYRVVKEEISIFLGVGTGFCEN